MFDTFCHEHLEYYSTTVINEMLIKNNLKLIDIKENDINGASKQFYIAKNWYTNQISKRLNIF